MAISVGAANGPELASQARYLPPVRSRVPERTALSNRSEWHLPPTPDALCALSCALPLKLSRYVGRAFFVARHDRRSTCIGARANFQLVLMRALAASRPPCAARARPGGAAEAKQPRGDRGTGLAEQ